MEVLDHKCPSCNATLKFNPKNQKWDCEYCGKTYELNELKEFENKQNESISNNKKSNVDADVYECPNCGAKIITDENTTATFCVYCGSTSIIKNRLTEEFSPVSIIPFKTTKEQAIQAFKKFKKGKLFAPKDFSNEENIQKISGVYIPFWIYDCKVNSNIDFLATRTTSWRSGDYVYTKKDEYIVKRGGSMEFQKVPVDGSTKFDDNTMDSIEPFIYDDMVDFNMSYLSGFLSEKYDVNSNQASIRASDRINKSIIDEFKSTVKGYTFVDVNSKQIDIDTKKSDYVLFPVWMLNINYKDKTYLFAMNGQTGKMIGDIPIEKSKIFIVWLESFAIITTILSIITFIYRLFA